MLQDKGLPCIASMAYLPYGWLAWQIYPHNLVACCHQDLSGLPQLCRADKSANNL